MSTRNVTMGDTVRVRDNAATRARGISGRTGKVAGGTRPSQTGVEVIGVMTDDHAVSVAVDGSDEVVWIPRSGLDYAGPGATAPLPTAEADKAPAGEPVFGSVGRRPPQARKRGWRLWRR